MRRAYLSMGSNLGDRAEHLRAAVRALGSYPQIEVIRTSPVYEGPAHTLDPDERQPPFLNIVVEIDTGLSPRALLAAIHQIERERGRVRSGMKRWAPRTLDIDILTVDGLTAEEDDLKLPHPRISERKFVLRPFADLAPDLMLPEPYSVTVADLLARTSDRLEVVRSPITIHGEADPA